MKASTLAKVKNDNYEKNIWEIMVEINMIW